MPEENRPGSWVGDSVNEFKKLPTWGKWVAGGILLLVVGVAWYEYQKSRSQQTGAAVGAAGAAGASLNPNASMAGGLQSAFSTTPGPNGSIVPIIPFGETPIFDALGNLIGWQQPNPNPTPSAPPPTPTTAAPFTWPAILKGMKVWWNPWFELFKYGKDPNKVGRFDLARLFPAGTTFTQKGSELDYTVPGGPLQVAPITLYQGKVPPPAVHKQTQKSPPRMPKVTS